MTPNWRLAHSLETLRTEIDTRWPHRSKTSDGTIGDPAHAATNSDHNPNPQGVVCALDITHDSTNGPDIRQLGLELISNPNYQAKYVIYDGLLASRLTDWRLRPYTGDPHTSHIHVSVGTGPDGHSRPPYDDPQPWFPKPPPTETPDMTPGQCRDRLGRKWFFIVGDDRQMWATLDGGQPWPIGGQFTSGLSAYCETDGLIVVAGRGTNGGLYQALIYTDGGPPPPPSGPVSFFQVSDAHIFPPE